MSFGKHLRWRYPKAITLPQVPLHATLGHFDNQRVICNMRAYYSAVDGRIVCFRRRSEGSKDFRVIPRNMAPITRDGLIYGYFPGVSRPELKLL
jgi:hypothetical protein